ncbi:MAG: MBL fold metallo-hydrolase [Kiritimatiellae bacterium]|nr:MBL fold metallo-hydrolase [Kiritimatiellia bacterium]
MRIVPIASSSKGNAYVVEHDGAALLIDCGVPYRMLKGIEVDAVLVTHSHSDHISGLETLLRRRDVPVYANVMTAESVAASAHVDDGAFVCFENGQTFGIGPFSITPFSVPHDTSDPVGYLVRADGVTYFHGTDIGSPLDSIGVKLAEADIATLESNHDPVMLRTSTRPPSLKQRIAGPRGHLSNDQACDLVRRFASPRLRRLMLAHLSHECNTPGLALDAMRAVLAEIGRPDVEVEVLG